jgi:hypothetical protein
MDDDGFGGGGRSQQEKKQREQAGKHGASPWSEVTIPCGSTRTGDKKKPGARGRTGFQASSEALREAPYQKKL